MKVYRDVTYVQKRKRMAVATSIIGVALLGSAFWMATSAGENAVLIAYVPLLIGTVLFHLGMQQVGKWNRPQRNDVVLDTLLKDLGDRYALVHYGQVGKRTVEHALVYPGGVISIVAREIMGGVKYENGKWRKVSQGIARFFGMGGAQLGNPDQDATNDVAALNGMLAGLSMPEEADAVIAFINSRVELNVEEPEFPVTNGDGLEPFIRSLPVNIDFRTADRDRVVEALTANGQFETPQVVARPRPVKRRVA
ncbi:MAG: hypothetical protein QM692_20245 [Thermomicrobiales bacterium]